MWLDDNGDGCAAYGNNPAGWCPAKGDANVNGEGSANVKCCACGGGSGGIPHGSTCTVAATPGYLTGTVTCDTTDGEYVHIS